MRITNRTMFKLNDLSIAGMIILIIILIVQWYYFVQSETSIDLRDLDYNKDGIVSRGELRYYLETVLERNKKKVVKKKEIASSIWGGVIRGFLMGLILKDMAGGIALGLALAAINPVIMSTQKMMF